MKNPARVASPLLIALLMSAPAYAAGDAADIAALKAQIKALSQKVDQLQTQETQTQATVATEAAQVQALPAASSDTLGKGTFPGSFKVPGTDTSVKIGGYVKLDMIEDAGSGYGASYAKFYNIPLNNSAQAQQGAQTTFNAQQTRVNFETRTPTAMGELKTFVEGDFYGAAGANSNTNGYGFELRHAYGALGSTSTGQLLAGQTWSNFMDTAAMPESMDYIGPAGTIFVRQAQARYTQDVGPVTLSASVEAPFGSGTSTQNGITYTGTTDTARGTLPDLVLRGDYKYASDGYTSLRLLGSDINIDHNSGPNNFTKSAYGYGIAVSGKQGTVDKDAVMYDFLGGKGTGRYVFDVNTSANYYNSTTNTLDTQNYFAGTVGYQHYWSEHFRSNLFGGYVRNVNETLYSGTAANKFVASGHANLIWQPVDAYKVALEYMFGYRKVENGEEGQLNRIQASFIYGF